MVEPTKASAMAVDGRKVTFRFGGKKSKPILDGLNISVESGIIYGLLGPSGCGKTTLLRCLVGRLNPSSGCIKIFGRVPGQKGCPVPGPGIGFMPQELALFPDMTTEETLIYFGRLYQMDRQTIDERIDFLARFLEIEKNKLIMHLSGGQQRRVSFAVALLHKPPLLILDEPTVGVDPLLRQSIWSHLRSLAKKDGITILITTHYVEEARQANVVGLMRDGRLLVESNPEDLIQKYNVPTLDDAFQILCAKDSEVSIETTENESTRLHIPTEGDWVTQKNRREKSDSAAFPSENGIELHQVSLLGSSADNNRITISPQNNTPWTGLGRSKNSRMAALFHKNYIRLKRNIGLIFFQLFIPAFQVIVFCLCIGGEPYDIPMAVVNHEGDPAGKGDFFLQCISNKTITQHRFENVSHAFETVKRGENWGVLHIKPNFTDNLVNRFTGGLDVDDETILNSTISLHLDMTNLQIFGTIFSRIMKGYLKFVEETLDMGFLGYKANPLLATPPVKIETPIYGDLEPNFTEFMAPGMILGIVYIMAVGISAMAIIIEKKEGLLERSLTAGARSWEIMFSILFALFLTTILQVILVLLFTFLAFSIPCKGPLFWVVIAVLLAGLEGMAYGLFISSIVNNENIAMMIAMGSFYPNLLMSGIIWPLEAMPYYIRMFSYCLPLTLIADSMRSILSRGWSITQNNVWAGYLVTLAWIFPVLLLATFFFKIKK